MDGLTKRGLAGLLMVTMVWIGWLLAAVGGIAAMLIICIVGLGLKPFYGVLDL